MKNIAEMESELMKRYCWTGSGIDEKILLKWKRNLRKILREEAELSIKFIIILCVELSGTNYRAELSAPNCPAPNCPRLIVRAELSCAELSGHPMIISGQSVEIWNSGVPRGWAVGATRSGKHFQRGRHSPKGVGKKGKWRKKVNFWLSTTKKGSSKKFWQLENGRHTSKMGRAHRKRAKKVKFG